MNAIPKPDAPEPPAAAPEAVFAKACLLGLAALAAVLLFWRLGATSLEGWDEGIYAEVAREMAGRGDWLTPSWNFQPWFEKPPLLMWAVAAGYRLGSVSEFWSRAPSALAGIALVLLTFATARRLSGRRAAILSALILLSTYTFLFLARHAMTDVLLCFFSWSAVYAYVRARDGEARWWILAWAGIAFSFLAKGFASACIPVALLGVILWEGRLRAALRQPHFWWGLLLALCIAAPWPVVMWFRHGSQFLGEFFGYHTLTRALFPLEGHRIEELYYLKSIFRGFFPWALLLPFALLMAAREHRRHAYRVLLLVPAIVFLFYFSARTKAYWYLLPAYPAFAILTASLIDRACEKYARLRRPVLLAFGITVALLLLAFLRSGLIPAAEQYLRWWPLYEKSESPVAELARLSSAQPLDDAGPLLLCVEHGIRSTAVVALFYSGRPIQQAYVNEQPLIPAANRYHNLKQLSDVVHSTTRSAILSKSLLPALKDEYQIVPIREAGGFVYALMRRRP